MPSWWMHIEQLTKIQRSGGLNRKWMDLVHIRYVERQLSLIKPIVEKVSTATESPTLTFVNEFYTANQATIKAAAAGFSSIDNKTIENAISTFSESVKVVMQGLDGLAQVHPFIAGKFGYPDTGLFDTLYKLPLSLSNSWSLWTSPGERIIKRCWPSASRCRT